MKKYFLIGYIISLMSCSSESDFEKGKQILENQGYTNVTNTGFDAFCCSDSDDWSTGFEATSKDSSIIHGCICSGIGKGITIRFE